MRIVKYLLSALPALSCVGAKPTEMWNDAMEMAALRWQEDDLMTCNVVDGKEMAVQSYRFLEYSQLACDVFFLRDKAKKTDGKYTAHIWFDHKNDTNRDYYVPFTWWFDGWNEGTDNTVERCKHAFTSDEAWEMNRLSTEYFNVCRGQEGIPTPGDDTFVARWRTLEKYAPQHVGMDIGFPYDTPSAAGKPPENMDQTAWRAYQNKLTFWTEGGTDNNGAHPEFDFWCGKANCNEEDVKKHPERLTTPPPPPS